MTYFVVEVQINLCENRNCGLKSNQIFKKFSLIHLLQMFTSIYKFRKLSDVYRTELHWTYDRWIKTCFSCKWRNNSFVIALQCQWKCVWMTNNLPEIAHFNVWRNIRSCIFLDGAVWINVMATMTTTSYWSHNLHLIASRQSLTFGIFNNTESLSVSAEM